MSLIDTGYFYGEINIAQIDQATVSSAVTNFIAKYEPKCLKQLLGVGFAIDFMDQVDPVSGTVAQRWLDLLNGKTYVYEGRTYQWMGFVNYDEESILANYIYYWWVRKEAQQTTGMGQVKPGGENGMIVSSQNTSIRAWNEMVEWAHSLILFLDAHRTTYPEWVPYSNNRWWMLDYYWPIYGYHGGVFRRDNRWPEVFYRINYLNI
ncbi:MAG: hypothetical protein ACYC2P_13370 [Paludibacteraceae bacterium]